MRRIDIAWFECPNCGHRSTPPEAINSIANEMEILERIPPTIDQEGQPVPPALPDEAQKRAQLEQRYKGNTVIIRNEGNGKVVRLARSHCKTEHDKTELAESDHITLKCPECDTILYDVDFRKRRRP